MRCVPREPTSRVSIGRATESLGLAGEARLTVQFTVPSIVKGRVMSCSRNWKCAWPARCDRLRGCPVRKLSSATTAWPSRSIAGLIFLLMVTYITGLWLSKGSPGKPVIAERVSWWLHTLALFAFLPMIPHTKHLHLALSPVTVFLKRAGFSRIPPLSGDEDFGLDTGKDVTRIDALQAFSCVECGRCSEHCPAYNTGKILNPKEIILGLRDYLKEHGPAAEAPLVGLHISEEALFQCTTCGACELQCPVGIQHLPMIVGLRRGAVNTGKWEDNFGTKLFLNLERNGNALGFSTT